VNAKFRIGVGSDSGTAALAVGLGRVWATNGKEVIGADLANPTLEPVHLDLGGVRAASLDNEEEDALWVGTTDGRLLRFRRQVLASEAPAEPQDFRLGQGRPVTALAIDRQFVWTADTGASVHRLPVGGTEDDLQSIGVADGDKAIASAGGQLWIANGGNGGLYRIAADGEEAVREADLREALGEGS
jgi:hypothetical protein